MQTLHFCWKKNKKAVRYSRRSSEEECVSRSVVSNSVTAETSPPGCLSLGCPRQAYWSNLPFLLQGIFSTQGSNQGLLHCRQMLYRLSVIVERVLIFWLRGLDPHSAINSFGELELAFDLCGSWFSSICSLEDAVTSQDGFWICSPCHCVK